MIVSRLLLVLIVSPVVTSGVGDSLGSRLAPGMQLVYSSGGIESPWTIDSVAIRLVAAGSRCLNVTLRMSPSQIKPDKRVQCTDGSMMTSWDEVSKAYRPVRPFSPGVLTLPRAGGSTRYEAAATAADTVSGIVLTVVPTVVSTLDSTGAVVRRLRERFAIEIATATSGVFEVPDASSASGWKTVREFQLTAIR